MGRKTQWLWRSTIILDRKFLSRWVLFSEDDELEALMTGDIL